MNRSVKTLVSIWSIFLIPYVCNAEVNPDLPRGGVRVDLNLGRSGKVLLAPFHFGNSYSDTDTGYYEYGLEGDHVTRYNVDILFPLSARVTGRIGADVVNAVFTEFHGSGERFNLNEQVRNSTVAEYSLGLRIYLGGEN